MLPSLQHLKLDLQSPDSDSDGGEFDGGEEIVGVLSYRVTIPRNCLSLLKKPSTRLR